MNCPHCHSPRTTQLKRITNLGYAVFCCKDCHRRFNERTNTPFNFLEFPTDIVFQVLLCRLRCKLSYRDVAEFFLVRGYEFTHETVRDWEARYAPILVDELRAKAKAFFRQTQDITDVPPEQVFTDGLNSYPRAIREELGTKVKHAVIPCLGNPIEQGHRGIKQRYYPTLGFGAFESAQRFCQAYDEVHQFFRPRQRMAEFVSLSDRQAHFLQQVDVLQEIFEAA